MGMRMQSSMRRYYGNEYWHEFVKLHDNVELDELSSLSKNKYMIRKREQEDDDPKDTTKAWPETVEEALCVLRREQEMRLKPEYIELLKSYIDKNEVPPDKI